MNDKQGPVKDAIRWVFGWIDWILYVVLGWVYEVFFDVSTVELLTGETIRNFCTRIQLILGVFMVFKISISVLQAIVDPDRITDKNNGFSAYIKRIIICLLMLTLIVPRNIPNASSEYEVQINNNGLLFGTLYSLQGRIMRNNTLGKLILGSSNDIISTADSTEEQVKKMNDLGNNFTSTIIRSFLKETSKCSGEKDGDGVKILKDENADAKPILNNHINETCGSLTKGYYYAIEYYPLIGGVVALAFTVILVGFSIDIAVRSVKIAVLRLLAPIPIISYLDPNQEKKGAFANWVKLLVSTYLDLFIRLALIYFVIFLIEDIRANGVVGYHGSDGNGPFVFIIICIGLYFFAKQAPKFIKDVLGVQNNMSNIGLRSIVAGSVAGAGTLVAGGGLAKAFSNMYNAGHNAAKESVEAINTGKGAPSSLSNFGKYASKTLQQRTGDKSRTWDLGGALDHWSDARMAEMYVPSNEIKKQKALLGQLNGQKFKIDNDLSDAMANRQALVNSQQNINSNLAQLESEKERITRQKYNLEALRKNNQISSSDFNRMYASADAEMTGIKTKETQLRNESTRIEQELNTVNTTITDLRAKQNAIDIRIADETDNLKDAKESRGFMVGKDEKFPKDKPFRAGTLDTAGQSSSSNETGNIFSGVGVNSSDSEFGGQAGRGGHR